MQDFKTDLKFQTHAVLASRKPRRSTCITERAKPSGSSSTSSWPGLKRHLPRANTPPQPSLCGFFFILLHVFNIAGAVSRPLSSLKLASTTVSTRPFGYQQPRRLLPPSHEDCGIDSLTRREQNHPDTDDQHGNKKRTDGAPGFVKTYLKRRSYPRDDPVVNFHNIRDWAQRERPTFENKFRQLPQRRRVFTWPGQPSHVRTEVLSRSSSSTDFRTHQRPYKNPRTEGGKYREITLLIRV